MIKFANEIKAMKLGNVEILKAYLGNSQVFPSKGGDVPSGDYADQYFTIEALDDGLSLGLLNTSGFTDLKFSINGGEWTATVPTSLKAGDKVRMKGVRTSNTLRLFSNSVMSTYRYNVYGNINSLYHGDDFKTDLTTYSEMFKYWFEYSKVVDASNLVIPYEKLNSFMCQYMFQHCSSLEKAPKMLPAKELTIYCYGQMFANCSALTKAPEMHVTSVNNGSCSGMFSNCKVLVETPVTLSATTLESNCYASMFQGCEALTKTPELPATQLAESCYQSMFAATAITEAPALPATELAKNCYYSMFQTCNNLTEAPALPATELAEGCYKFMFSSCALTKAPDLLATELAKDCYYYMMYGCHTLNYVKCMAENPSLSYCGNWLNYVSPTGTFVKKKGVTWESGANGIPDGWTIEEVD